MVLYYANGCGKVTRIANIDGRMTGEKITSEIDRLIKAHCDRLNYKIPYTRILDVEFKGRLMTKFDVGSHVEFFYTDPPSYDLYAEQRRKQKELELKNESV